MAVKVIRQVPSKFLFEDTVVGMRMPTVDEMKAIVDKRQQYLKTVRAEIIEDKRDDVETGMNREGDGQLMLDLQKEVSMLLCCDPEDVDIPWFAKDAAEQKQLAAQNIHKQLPDELPATFHSIAFQVFTVASAAAKAVDFTKNSDEEIEEAADKQPPLSDETPTAVTTTLRSDDRPSESPSISTSTQSGQSDAGTITNS